jgi:predicted helicase
VGNPPWSNFGRQNGSPWMTELLSDYRAGLAERKSNLTDDAVKFIRWGQHWIDRAGRGILAFVTPRTWLDGLTHRQMRESLLRSFDKLLVVDLHGEPNGPAGDENVFGVRSGVAMVVLVKLGATARTESSVLGSQDSVPGMQQDTTQVRHLDLTGTRSSKFNALAPCSNSASWGIVVQPTPPHWPISPRDDRPERRARCTVNYETFWPLNRIFHHYISGVQTKNDAVFVAFTREQLAEQVQQFLAAQVSPIEFAPHFIQPYLVAPFDRRFVYYDPRLIGRARYSVMRHMLRPNLGLVFMRQSTGRGDYDHFLAVDCLVSDRVFYSRHGAPFLAPLWLEEGSGFGVQGPGVSGDESASSNSVLGTQYSVLSTNFHSEFMTTLRTAINGPAESTEVFSYLYAIAHSPTYRQEFAAELRRGFPRFPLPQDEASFRKLESLGGQLMEMHIGRLSPEARLPPAEDTSVAFRLGGYDVLRRWQAPRAKRGLTPSERRELEHLAWMGRETRRIAVEIDTHSRDLCS